MKNILLATDFSNASINAGNYAVSLANVFETGLILIHTFMIPVMVDDTLAASVLNSNDDLVKGNEALMEKEILRLSVNYVNHIEGIVRIGPPVEMINEAAKEKNAEIIVVGTKGSGVSNSIFGSTTTALIRKTDFPVLVIPETTAYMPVSTIIFAADYAPETKVDPEGFLIKLARKFNPVIKILNVKKNVSVMNKGEVVGKMEIDTVFKELRHYYYTVENDDVINGINDFIQENPAEILAMPVHKHSLPERIFGKIYTKSMSRQTKIPLLILKNR